ncbi:MAG: hypothetical protein HYU88_00265 [Chloroflexi bacterium]|nr:hypothetical protein [Chloroflexota bacterium]MBI4507928.1 hypothetical protein [Chloroflexota bacterium]
MAISGIPDPTQRANALKRYYATSGSLIGNALQARVEWLKSLDEVIEEFDKRGVNAGRVKAGLIGAQYNSLFERYLQAFVRLQPPPGADDFHQRWVSWLQRLTRANFCLSEGASRSDFRLLEEACTTLEEARPLLVTITRVTAIVAPDLLPAARVPGQPVGRAAPPPAPAPVPSGRAAPDAGRKPAPAATPTAPGTGHVKVAAKTVDPKQQKRK